MIDSVIWKEKLKQGVNTLQKKLDKRRWSSRAVVLFERELMLMFFSVRALIEAGKLTLTDRISYKEYKFLTYPNKGEIVDDITKYDIDELFDLSAGAERNLSLKILTHQFVHAYIIDTEFSPQGNVIGVLLCSGWKKDNFLVRVPIRVIIEILQEVISDEITSAHLKRSTKTGELRKVKIL